MEVGAQGPLCIDSFSLPVRRRKSKGTVSFDDSVVVFQGKDYHEEFQPLRAITNDLQSCPNPRFCPAGHRGRSAYSGSVSSRPTGSLPVSHFLDRRLPDDVLATFIIFKIVGVINYFGYQTVDAIVSVHGTFIHRLHQRVWINPRIIQLVGELAPKSPVELARSSSQ